MSPDFLKKCKIEFSSRGINFKNSHILVAVSGGVDSMVLLHALNSLKHEFNIQISCAHINHNLRPDSNQDQDLVESTCHAMGISVNVKKLNPASIKQGQSIEEWGRVNRYSFLKQTLTGINADYIVTAHHANDQAETLLMHLSEGSGPLGLSGISKMNDSIIRPFLNIKKDTILQYAVDNNISFRDDITNLNLNHPRNYIRSKVIKSLEVAYPNAVHQFQSSADIFSKYNQTMDFFIQNAMSSLDLNISKNITVIKKDELKLYPLLAQSMIIKKISNNDNMKWRKHNWKELDSFLQSDKTGSIMSFPNHYQILNDRDEWKVREKNGSLGDDCDISIGITYENELFTIQLKETDSLSYFSNSSSNETIDAKMIEGKKLKVRPWIPSDQFQPLGMNGTQKLSDFFINRKLDRFEKDQQYVLTADNEIMWICGRQISHKVRIRPTTTKAINLKFNWK